MGFAAVPCIGCLPSVFSTALFTPVGCDIAYFASIRNVVLAEGVRAGVINYRVIFLIHFAFRKGHLVLCKDHFVLRDAL